MDKPAPIFDITRFTQLDYPDKLAAIVWFSKCNMRCQYCYNSDIVLGEGNFNERDLLKFLNNRIGKLDGVVLSGGEATMYPNLLSLCEQIKSLGFSIKLDTNGLQTTTIQSLVNKSLVDYIALDYKAPKYLFEAITGNSQWDNFYKTLNMLIKQNNVMLEIRTTVHTSLLSLNDIYHIIDDLLALGYKNTYSLQNFLRDVPTLGALTQQKETLNYQKIEAYATGRLNIEFRNFG